MIKSLFLSSTKLLWLSLTVLFLFVSFSNAATRTWDGGGSNTNWGTAANWVGDIAPVAGDDLIFPATATQFTASNDIGVLLNFNSLKLEGGNYTIGGLPFSLTVGITANGGTHTFNTIIRLSAPQTYTIAQGATLTFTFGIQNMGNTLTVDSAGTTIVVGTISGAGGLTKRGNGILGLLFNNTYTGATTIEGGLLIVDGSMPNNPITLAGGGLAGSGTVGAVTATAVGLLSAGTLTSLTSIFNINGNVSLNSQTALFIKLNGNTAGTSYDQIKVTGAVNLNGCVLAPTPLNNFTPAIGDVYRIIDNDGTDAITGTFTNIPEGAIFTTPNNIKFRVTYRGGDGNDVTITRIGNSSVPADFDGDGKTDLSIFRPSVGQWWYQQSSDNTVKAFTFGSSSDKIVPADYDGDGKTDVAFWRPSTGEWFVLRSSDLTFFAAPFGVSTDTPAPGDFDGDRKADFTAFRPSIGTWFINKSSGGVEAIPFGINGDIPVVSDYDKDGKSDIAIYRPMGGSGNGEWWILRSESGLFATPFGAATDKPVVGDYTGDGKADVAFFRPSSGEWFVLRSEDLSFYAAPFGTSSDIPSPGDYDGDGKFDFAVFRPSSATWFVLKSSGGTMIQQFGVTGDKPIPSAFVP